MRWLLVLSVTVTVASSLCWADSITFDGKTYDNVYIREGAEMYYVQIPESGTVVSVAKTTVDARDVDITPNAAQRTALLTQWKENHAARYGLPSPTAEPPPAPDPPVHAEWRQARPARETMKSADRAAVATSGEGYVGHVRLRNVTLRDALKAVLRSNNLDYSVEDGYLWVSSPERLRQESMERPETGSYSLGASVSADTLPKVALQNPGRTAQGYASGVGGYGNQGFGAGIGGGSSRFGGGFGSQGFGGGFRGGYGGSIQISNIAQLFSTIDDRLVGEPPAQIGIGGLR